MNQRADTPNRNELINGWYEQHHANMYRYAIKKLHNSEIAEDCIQETFRIATEKVEVLANHRNIGGWLMQTLKNQIALFFRSEAQKKKLYAKIAEKDGSYLTYIDNWVSEAVIYGMKDKLLADLSEKEQLLYNLFYERKLKIKEIAQRENTTEAAVKMRLMRLRNKIYDKMKGFFK